MRLAETVTFGGSGLDRAAQKRSDPEAMAALLSDPAARVLPFWQEKPYSRAAGEGLVWVETGSDMLIGAELIFLGLDADGPRFAADLKDWAPDAIPDTLGAFLDPSLQTHPMGPKDAAFAELRAIMAGLTPREAELAATGRGLIAWHKTHGFCAKCGHASDMIEAGWQRKCPACGARHFPRTDPVVIMLILRGNSVLVGRSPGWPEGMYSLLAGFVEPGETIEAAVRREVFEEAGVVIGEVTYLASQPWPFPASLMIGCLGVATTDEITIDPIEIEDARWITREEMVEVQAGRHADMRPARKGAIARFLIEHWLADRLD